MLLGLIFSEATQTPLIPIYQSEDLGITQLNKCNLVGVGDHAPPETFCTFEQLNWVSFISEFKIKDAICDI